MKKNYTGIFIISILLCACGKEELFDLYGKDVQQTLSAYHQISSEKTGAPAMYIDFSAGMNTAFGAPGMKELMATCFNTLLSQKFEAYKMAESQVTPLQVTNPTELGLIVNDPKQYLDVRAPIQVAVEKIVDTKNDALLITDFEEWQSNMEVTTTAYLKIAFSKWLKAGNSISFFVTDYQEGKVQKHVYFTVFTYGKANGMSLIDKLRPRLSTLPKFDLSTQAYRIITDYPGERTGGLYKNQNGKSDQEQNVLDLQASYFKQSDFEYYPLGVDWKTIGESRQELTDFQELFRKLFIDLSNNDSYLINSLEVKTFDATTDYERYAQSVEAAKHPPKIVKDANGADRVDDLEKDPIALACYEPNGKLKPAYHYEPSELPAVNELFVLNNSLFDNTFKTNPSKTEIGVAFAPGFNSNKIPNAKGLLKITVNVKEASINNNNPVLNKLQWVNKNGIANVGLYASIMETLQELKPNGQTLYTYYIKTTEQN